MSAPSFPEFARLSEYDFTYLLSGRDDERSRASRAILGLPSMEEAAPFEKAGAASLVARSLIDIDQETVLPKNWVGLVGHTLGTASHWISIVAQAEDGRDFSLLVQGDAASLLLRPVTAIVFDLLGLDRVLSLSAQATSIIEAYLDSHPECAILVRSMHPDGDMRNVFVKRSSESGWQFTEDIIFPTDAEWPAPDADLEASDREAVLKVLAEQLMGHEVTR